MARSSKKWAVLIGIDFYLKESNRLDGAVNDAEDMSSLLQQFYSPINITKYVAVKSGDSEQKVPTGPKEVWPTYDNVTRQLKQIIQIASPGDHVYFHYSGHGTLSSTMNRNYQTNARSDAALVLFDDISASGMRYLRGIELSSLFNQMVTRQLKLTAILDCCHSGGVSRGKYSFRGLPWDDRIASAYPLTLSDFKNVTVLEEDRTRKGKATDFWLLSPNGYSVIAACGPDERAFEGSGSDGIPHGILSLHFRLILASIARAGREIDLESVYRKVCARMHVSVPDQHPLLLGHCFVSFMGDTILRQTGTTGSCEVIDVQGDGTISLNVGYAHGVCKGDEYIVYDETPSNKTTTSNSQSGMSVVVNTVAALHSEALPCIQSGQRSLSSTNTTRARRGWYGALTKPFRPKAHVHLFAGAGDEWIREINNSLWLQTADVTQITASLPSFTISITDENEYEILRNEQVALLDLPSTAVQNKHAPAIIISAVEHMAKFANIELLDNQIFSTILDPGDFSINIEDTKDPNNMMEGNFLQVSDGGEVRITFRNNSNRSLSFAILDLMPLGEICRLYPGDRDYFTVPPTNANFNGRESFEIDMSIPDSLKNKGQSRSDDVLKFFITTQPTSFDMLQLRPLSKTLENPSRGSSQLLWNVLESLVSNGPVYEELRAGGNNKEGRWACQNFTIRTVC